MRVTAFFVSLYKYKKREINEGLISSVTRLMYKTCVVWCHDAEASHALTRLYLLIMWSLQCMSSLRASHKCHALRPSLLSLVSLTHSPTHTYKHRNTRQCIKHCGVHRNELRAVRQVLRETNKGTKGQHSHVTLRALDACLTLTSRSSSACVATGVLDGTVVTSSGS